MKAVDYASLLAAIPLQGRVLFTDLADFRGREGKFLIRQIREQSRYSLGFKPDLFGIDISFKTTLAAVDGVCTVTAGIGALPFANGSFDTVFSPSTIDHLGVDEVPRAFAEIFRVLKPGGIAVMIADNRDNFFHHLSIRLQRRLRIIPFHVERCYFSSEIEALSLWAGLTPYYSNTILAVPEILNRLLNYLRKNRLIPRKYENDLLNIFCRIWRMVCIFLPSGSSGMLNVTVSVKQTG